MSWINFPQLCYTPHLLSSSLKLSLSRQLGYRDTVVMIEQQRPRLALWLPKRRLRYFGDVHKKWCKIVVAVKKNPTEQSKSGWKLNWVGFILVPKPRCPGWIQVWSQPECSYTVTCLCYWEPQDWPGSVWGCCRVPEEHLTKDMAVVTEVKGKGMNRNGILGGTGGHRGMQRVSLGFVSAGHDSLKYSVEAATGSVTELPWKLLCPAPALPVPTASPWKPVSPRMWNKGWETAARSPLLPLSLCTRQVKHTWNTEQRGVCLP